MWEVSTFANYTQSGIIYRKTQNLYAFGYNVKKNPKTIHMKHKFSINRFIIAFTVLLLAVVFQGCQWEHDGKVLKDKDGNLYRLEASGYRNESYDLKPLPTADIDSLLN